MTLLTTAVEFNNLCHFLHQNSTPYIAIDTEFVRENTYWPEWSLLQIATAENAYIIDITQLDKKADFNAFKELLCQRSLLKVFHACRQDIEIFLNELDVMPETIFDCQVAAYMCGFLEGIGLAKLAHALLGIEVIKTQQHTNWLTRPLSAQQLAYASVDVQVIQKMYLILRAKLDELGRWGWLYDEQAHLTQVNTYRPDGNELWRRLKTPAKLKPAKRALLQELCRWREEKAQELNYNRAKVITDDMLIKLIGLNVETLVDLIDHMPLLKPDRGEEVWAVLQLFKERHPHTYPQLKYPSPRPIYLPPAFMELSTLRSTIANQLGIAERLLGNNEALKDFISGDKVIFSQGWRYEVFGKKAEEILSFFISQNEDKSVY